MILNASEVEPRIRQSRRAIRSSKLGDNAQELWINEAWGTQMLKNVDDPDHWLKLARETRALANRVSFDTAKKRLVCTEN